MEPHIEIHRLLNLRFFKADNSAHFCIGAVAVNHFTAATAETIYAASKKLKRHFYQWHSSCTLGRGSSIVFSLDAARFSAATYLVVVHSLLFVAQAIVEDEDFLAVGKALVVGEFLIGENGQHVRNSFAWDSSNLRARLGFR